MRATQSDYILRLIEQLGAALRRLRERLAGGHAEVADEVILEAVDAQADLFGPLWEVIRTLDAETAASLIPERERLSGWIELLRLEADAAHLAGDEARASNTLTKATQLQTQLDSRPSPEGRYR